ncbi:aminoacyl-tRNA hydrolase [Candidatus Gottesmanbacteria bacterium]|nr:aminoacyl-tRNA hydrolase [Candidatus Gottesmanbacteria bacterium]
MKLIVGLGNPGKKYEKTRHNLGFMAVDELVRKWTEGEPNWKENKKLKSLICKKDVKRDARAWEITSSSGELILVKPQTYMNNSGMAVVEILRYYDMKILSDLWVIHDDLDIPVGRIKIVKGKGTAGHHGIISIVEALGSTDFVRFRIGISRENIDNPDKFVLMPFLPIEKDEIRHAIKQALLAIEVALKDGVEKAMSQFNR